MKKLFLVFVLLVSISFQSCMDTDANVASRNLSKAAEQFEIYRRVVFYNGMTDSYILTIEGYCSIEDSNGQLEVTVKTQDSTYLKHYLGLSENVTYFAEQLQSKDVSADHYKVIFKPSTLVPSIEVK